jgi:hypothetical protein
MAGFQRGSYNFATAIKDARQESERKTTLKASKQPHEFFIGRVVAFALVFLAAIVAFKPAITFAMQVQANSSAEPTSSAGLSAPSYQADFTPVIANSPRIVSWNKGYLASSGDGEMKEPVALYDKSGKWLFEHFLTFENAIKVYAQNAAPTNSGTVVVAASALKADGTAADLIVEVGKDGIRRIIRTSPFYATNVCVTEEGLVWAFGHELNAARTAEPRAHHPILREYSLDKGELRSALDRATFIPPRGVPIQGSRRDVYLKCARDKVVLVSGSTNELVEYDLASSKLSRYPIAGMPEGFYMTGAAVTDSGGIYVSASRPGENALTGMARLQVNSSSGTADWTFLAPAIRPAGRHFVLLGSDGEDLVYSRGHSAPTLFWSTAAGTGVAK